MKTLYLFRSFIEFVLGPIKRNAIFFVFLYALGIITALTESYILHLKIPRFNFLSLILDVYLLCLLIILIPGKCRTYFRFFISFIAYFLAIVNAFCVEYFYARIGPEILNVILETNPQESSEFIDKYINLHVFLSSVGIIFVLLLFHLFSGLYIKYFKIKIPLKISIILNVISFLILLVSFSLCIKSRIGVVKLMMASTLEEVDLLVGNHSQNTPINNLLFSIKMRDIDNNGLSQLADTQDKVMIDSCIYTSSKIVLIIGESYIKDHSQLYGYKEHTTPLQMKRAKITETGCLVPFEDVISPSNLTSIVFKNVFSLSSYEEKVKWANAPLFPVIFRRAGYKVFFITNQFVQALNTDIFDVSGGLFLNNKKLSKAQFDYRNIKTHRYDMDLLADYDSLRQYQSNHNLFIFHLAGQHIDFYKRSPEEFKIFNITNYKHRIDINNEEKQIVADYDNATYYNDVVVDSIIKKFEKDNAIIIYMPDHGEECYDETHRMGRVRTNDYTPEILRQEFRIPFWIWCSKKYIITHQEIFNQILDSKKKPFMTDDLPHLLLYLGGISCEYYNENKNLLSPCFDKKRKRMINGRCDYDSIVKNQ